ncbi:hypothetical protein HK405_006378 [Cladochytrium tenue]|nr:hypothetical protein HK405_006378 [Cladochytrium tenue]
MATPQLPDGATGRLGLADELEAAAAAAGGSSVGGRAASKVARADVGASVGLGLGFELDLVEADPAALMAKLSGLTPSGQDFVVRAAGSGAGLAALLRGCAAALRAGTDFELAHSVLHMCLRAHADMLLDTAAAADAAATGPGPAAAAVDDVLEAAGAAWGDLEGLFHESMAVLEFVR